MDTPWSNPTAEQQARRNHWDFIFEMCQKYGINPSVAACIDNEIWAYHSQPKSTVKAGSEPLNADEFAPITQW